MPNKYEVNPLETHKNKFAKEMDFRQSWIEQDMVQNDQDVHFLGLAHSIEILMILIQLVKLNKALKEVLQLLVKVVLKVKN